MATAERTAALAAGIIPIRDAKPLVLPPFDAWKYEDAVAAVKHGLPANYAERKLYGESGDHWNGGSGWVGPGALIGSSNQAAVSTAIQRQFAPHDAIGEALSAIEDAFSAEAQIGAVPVDLEEGADLTAEQENLIAECKELLTMLWDRVKLHEAIKPAIRRSTFAERSSLRWWIPPGRALRVSGRDDAGNETERVVLPPVADFKAAIEFLALSEPQPNAATIFTDEPTQEKAAIYLDEIRENDRDVKRAQVAFVRDETLVIRTLWENQVKAPSEDTLETAFLPLAEMTAENLLTPAVLATQRQLDYIESVLTRTIETAGFPERYIKDAKPTGVWVPLADGEIPTGPTQAYNGKTYQLKPEPRTLGSSITTELVGIDYTDSDGKTHHASPDVTRFEPVDPDFAIKAGKHARAKILQMLRQAHRAGDSTAESSGLAYEQARSAFLKLLLNLKGSAENMTRDFLTAALGLMEALTNKSGYFTGRLRITVEMHVDAGPRSPTERAEDRADVEDGLLSHETAMSRGGIEDVGAEVDRINQQPGARLDMLDKVAEVFAKISAASSAPAAVRALIAAGVEPEIANAMLAADTDGATEL